MKTAILGAGGQLGTALQQFLPGEVIPLTRSDVDADDSNALRAKLAEIQPTHLINCTAYNFVDRAEHEPEAAFRTNAYAVRGMARICAELDAFFVHVSTDYVFGLEDRFGEFRESDAPGPISVYGASKLAGEYFARAYAPRHLVVRTCGLYGTRSQQGGKGTNFVETMLRLAKEGKSLKVISDQICTPSFAGDVAFGMAELLRIGQTGLFHVANSGRTTWFDFARAIFDIAHLKPDLAPTTAAAYAAQFPPEKRPAPRPANSLLSKVKYLEAVHSEMPYWRDGLEKYMKTRPA